MRINEIELLDKIKKYYEDGLYKDGLDFLIANEDVIEKKYYEIIKYKLMFYIKLNKEVEASILIKEELSVPYVPADFEEFLTEKKRQIDFILKENRRKTYSSDDIESIDKLDNETLLSILPNLKKYNLNGYHNQFQNILLNTAISDLTKSLLIACLSDVKLNETFFVIKEQTTIKFNPCNIFDIREGENTLYIEEELKDLNDIEINTLEIIKRLSTTYLLNIYPLEIEKSSCDQLICACILLASQMINQTIKSAKYEQIFLENRSEVLKYCEKLNILLETI